MAQCALIWLALLIFFPMHAVAQDDVKVGDVQFTYGSAKIAFERDSKTLDDIAARMNSEKATRVVIAGAQCTLGKDQQILADARVKAIRGALLRRNVYRAQLALLDANGDAACGLVQDDSVVLNWQPLTAGERTSKNALCKIDSDGDRIPDCVDRCNDSKPGTVIGDDGCVTRLHDEYYGGMWLLFASGSAEIQPEVRKLIVNFERQLLRSLGDGYRAKLIGHSDTCGTPKQQRELSKKRAQNVADYLIRQGLNPGIISEVRGEGASQIMSRDGCPSDVINRVEMQVDNGRIPVQDKSIYIDSVQDNLGGAQEARVTELTKKTRQWGQGTVTITSLAGVCKDSLITREIAENHRKMVIEHLLAGGLRLNQLKYSTEPDVRLRALAKCGFKGEHQLVVEEAQ